MWKKSKNQVYINLEFTICGVQKIYIYLVKQKRGIRLICNISQKIDIHEFLSCFLVFIFKSKHEKRNCEIQKSIVRCEVNGTNFFICLWRHKIFHVFYYYNNNHMQVLLVCVQCKILRHLVLVQLHIEQGHSHGKNT